MNHEVAQSSGDIADWNRIADNYVAQAGEPDPLDNPMYGQIHDVLWDSLGDLNGLEVLDLGCGDGWLSRMMVDAGARVTGVDGAEALLSFARSRCPDSEFVESNLVGGLPPFGKRFDRVVSTMVLMDIPDLTVLTQDVGQALTESGRFIFTILHPCFFQYKIHFDKADGEWYRRVTSYMDEQVWRIDSFGGHNHYHRNLTYYANALQGAGMAITRLYEPVWDPPDGERREVVRRWPICLLIEARPMPRR